MQADICYELDVATGKEKAAHQLPEDIQQKGPTPMGLCFLSGGHSFWRRLGAGRLLKAGVVGVRSEEETDGIFAIDVTTGKHLWAYRGSKTIEHSDHRGWRR